MTRTLHGDAMLQTATSAVDVGANTAASARDADVKLQKATRALHGDVMLRTVRRLAPNGERFTAPRVEAPNYKWFTTARLEVSNGKFYVPNVVITSLHRHIVLISLLENPEMNPD